MKQVQSALNAEEASLLSTTQDWGWRDDMYQYAAGQNPEFIESNTKPDALATLNLNLFMILDDTRETFSTARSSHPISGQMDRFPQTLKILSRATPA